MLTLIAFITAVLFYRSFHAFFYGFDFFNFYFIALSCGDRPKNPQCIKPSELTDDTSLLTFSLGSTSFF